MNASFEKTMNNPLIQLRQLSKSYSLPASQSVTALRDVTLDVPAGTYLALTGKSGSGKSTLLHLLTGIDQATTGEVCIGGQRLNDLPENELARWRGRNVGIVFQFFQLMPTLTALENVVFAIDLVKAVPRPERSAKARHLLERVGLSAQVSQLPGELSGGQQQRVAIARALANDPPLLVADEPTGNLDSQTAASILDLFDQLQREGVTLVVVTHDDDVARRAQRLVRLSDGRVVEDVTHPLVRA
jgi:ABC-type lipoprotein export system ATPase subunit